MSRARNLADLLDSSGDVKSASLDNEISLGDNVKAKFGAGDDLQIYHDGNDSYITDTGTGLLFIRGSSGVRIQGANGENGITLNENASADLYYDNSKKLATTSSGVDISGNLQLGGTNIINSGLAMYNLESFKMADGKKAIFGSSDDLQIYHDGNHSIIEDVGTGAIKIKVGDFRVENASGNNLIKGVGDVASLHHAGATKLATTSSGVDISGSVTANTEIEVTGSSAYLRLTSTSGTGECELRLGDSADTDAGSIAYQNNGDYMQFRAGAAERMRIDSAGRMMLGQTWPYAPTGGGFTPLTLTGSGNSRTDLVVSNQTNGADSGAAVVLGAYGADHIIEGQSAAQGGALTFTKSGSERLRIDSSGNVLYGKMDASIAVEGTFIGGGGNNGTVEITRDQNRPLRLNRTSSNGSILELLKDGSTAGIIGAVGTQSYIHGGGTDVGLYWGSNNIYPYRQAGLNDATIDLGQSSKRFKDLYLSGSVYISGQRISSDGSGSLDIGYGKTGTTSVLDIYDNTSKVFTVKRGGNVGINHGLGGGNMNSKFNVFADGEALRLDGTANTSRTLRFRNTGTNGSSNAIITSDGTLQIKNEDANAALYFNSVRNMDFQVTSGNGTAGHFTFSSYNTEIMRIDGANNRVGIGSSAPSQKLTVYENNSSYGSTAIHVHNDKADDAAILILEGKRSSTNDTAQIIMANDGDNVAAIKAYSGADEGELRFYTSPTGSGDVLTQRLTIDSSGRALIGITGASGYGQLETTTFTTEGQCILARTGGEVLVGTASNVVASSNAKFDMVFPDNSGIAMGSAYTYANIYGSGGDLYLRANAYPANTGSPSKIHLQTANGSGGQASEVVIDNGNVGIATQSPTAPLEIKKSANFYTSSTSSWTNSVYVGTSGKSYTVSLASSENNYSQQWSVSGSPVYGTCYAHMVGDSGHAHSKDIQFRVNSGYLQFKNVSYSTGRNVVVYQLSRSV